MRIELPLEVLSWMAPVLSWVEGPSGLSLPDAWIPGSADADRRLRSWLLHELPNYSYDTVDEIRQLTCAISSFEPSSKMEPREVARQRLEPPPRWDLAAALDHLTDRYFVWSQGSAAVRERRMEEIHELSLRFPVGHLIRHFHARAVSRGLVTPRRAAEQPDLLGLLPSNSHGLRNVVRRGLSEGHLHLKAVNSAEESWADIMLREASVDALSGYAPVEKRLLLLSRYCGRLLALLVLSIELRSPGLPLPWRFLASFDALYFAHGHYEDHVYRQALGRQFREQLEQWRFNLSQVDGSDLWEDEGLEGLLFWIDRTTWWLRRQEGAAGEPPDSAIERGRLLGRLHLRAHGLLLDLPTDSPARHLLQQLLFRYLVCRTHHWQLATQSGHTTGLRHFKGFYDSRIRRPRRNREELQGLILNRLRHWRGLRVLEGRIAPPRRGPADLVPWIAGYAEGAERKRLRKFGLVVHFIKGEARAGATSEWALGLMDLRHGHIRRVTRNQSFRLFRLLAHTGPWVPFIVGIDAANLELTTPPEVYAPAFRFLREFPIEPRREADVNSDRFKVQAAVRRLVDKRRLGMTYHVGEDFRHILSGLRAIWEAAEFLNAQPGDRLGHATALGLDPGVWAEQSGYQAVVPRLEWLDTLVWVIQLLGTGDERVIRLSLEDKIQKLAWQLFVPEPRDGHEDSAEDHWDLSILTLHDAWRLRQLDPYFIDMAELAKGRLRFRDGVFEGGEWWRWRDIQRQVHRELVKTTGSPFAYRLLHLYWFDPGVRERGGKLEVVDMQDDWPDWRALCDAVQECTIGEVRRRELVVEVNPTVNRVIGPMAALHQHPVFHLSLDEERRLKRDVRVTVNTDNPAVFSTTLAHEFYLLGEVLRREGRPESEVVEWLDWLRENGIHYSFVRQLPEHSDPDMGVLLEAVRKSRPPGWGATGRDDKLRSFEERQDDLFRNLFGDHRPAAEPEGSPVESEAVGKEVARRIRPQSGRRFRIVPGGGGTTAS